MRVAPALLARLYPALRNEIRWVGGPRRRAVDAILAADVLGKSAAELLRRVPSLVRGGRRRAAGPSLLAPYKYAVFNGHLYVDCFYPRFPGKVFDRLVAQLLANLGRPPAEWSPATFALILSMTKKCVYRCEHCYAIETLGSRDVLSLDDLRRIAREFRRLGVGVIAWEGGEPLMRFDELLTLVRENRDETEALVATTGWGLTREKAERLAEAGLVSAIISLDHWEADKHNAFRRNRKAFDAAVAGVRLFREAGVLPSVCICATRETVAEGGLYRYLELAREIGAAFVQILDATPSGSYLGKDVILGEAQLAEIRRFHREVNGEPRWRDHPSVSARALLEDDGQYGCCAGNALCYVDSSGNLQACDLLQISFGNVVEEGADAPWRRMKSWFPHMIAGRCPAQTLHERLAEVHARAPSLPLRHEDCLHILDEIRRRGPAPRLR